MQVRATQVFDPEFKFRMLGSSSSSKSSGKKKKKLGIGLISPDHTGADLDRDYNSTGKIFGEFNEMKAIELNNNTAYSARKMSIASILVLILLSFG